MEKAQRIEIGLADRIDDVPQPMRDERLQLRNVPAHRHDKGEGEIGECRCERAAIVRQDRLGAAVQAAEKCPEDEEKLPGQGVEEPAFARRIARQIDVRHLDDAVKEGGGNDDPERAPLEPPQHERKDEQQHDIKRQNVEVRRAELQEQGLDERCRRIVEEVDDLHLLGE